MKKYNFEELVKNESPEVQTIMRFLEKEGYTIARTNIIFLSLVLFGIVGMVLGFILGRI